MAPDSYGPCCLLTCPEHPAEWSSGPSEPHQPRQQKPGCCGGLRSCTPPPSAGLEPSRCLMRPHESVNHQTSTGTKLPRSSPVPSGTMPMGGSRQTSLCLTASRTPRTQPTVPSPPQTKILNLGTSLKEWRLGGRKRTSGGFREKLFMKVCVVVW